MDRQDTQTDNYQQFFNPIELGQSLREVSTDMLSAGDGQVISRWFHGSKETDLYIWMDLQKNVLKQQISFFGQVVEWNVVEGLRTGVVVEDDRNHIAPTDMVRFDTEPLNSSVQQALQVLQNTTVLTESERQELAANFKNGKPLSASITPEEFMERFSGYIRPKRTGALPKLSLWQRLLQAFGFTGRD